MGFVVGFALFGALTYLPLFQQIVRGLSPTASGLQLVPLMAGLLATLDRLRPADLARPAATRSSRSSAPRSRGRAVPALAASIRTTGTLEAASYMLVLGLGLGLVMQVLVLAVQNAVPYAQLGVATSSATLFRSIGGSLGDRDPRRDLRQPARRTSSPPSCRRDRPPARTSPPARSIRLRSLAAARPSRRLTCTRSRTPSRPCSSSPRQSSPSRFLLAWILEERPLRKTIEDRDVGDAFPPPQDTDSIREITRELSRLVGRDRTRRFIEGVIAQAEADLTPAEAWLLGRAQDGTIPRRCGRGPRPREQRDPPAGPRATRDPRVGRDL